MNCKNCDFDVIQKDNFCRECGAKIIKERISIKSLLSNALVGLGWDSNFFVTLRYLSYKPQLVVKEYIEGTRKKYANPFTFFAIILAISLFVFSQYSEEFMEISLKSAKQMELSDKEMSMFGYKNQVEFTKAMLVLQMKYYNLVSSLGIPLYTLLAFLVFRKPYNYGEHLIISTYLIGYLTFTSMLLFIVSLLTGTNIFDFAILIMFFYYSFTYKKLYSLPFIELVLKILKLLGVLFLISLIPLVIGIIYTVNR